MHIHQGKVGGPDCSNATDVAQCAMPTPEGLRKFTVTFDRPGQEKLLTNVLGGHFVDMMFGQEQNADCEFGPCGADGNLDAPAPHAAKATGQGRVLLYARPHVNHADYASGAKFFKFKSHDGKPITITVGVGTAI